MFKLFHLIYLKSLCVGSKHSEGMQPIGGSRGRVAGVAPPALVGKFYQKKGQFWPFLGLHPPFQDQIVDKSSHERLQPPPFQKFQDPPMQPTLQHPIPFIYFQNN